jgi:hypothetical protein
VAETAAERFLIVGLVLALGASLLSGPVALVIVDAAHSQPPWQGSATFAASYHPVQLLPYLLGLLLGAFATTWDRAWLMSPSGLLAFGAWNLLVVVMCLLALAARVRRPKPSPA